MRTLLSNRFAGERHGFFFAQCEITRMSFPKRLMGQLGTDRLFDKPEKTG